MYLAHRRYVIPIYLYALCYTSYVYVTCAILTTDKPLRVWLFLTLCHINRLLYLPYQWICLYNLIYLLLLTFKWWDIHESRMYPADFFLYRTDHYLMICWLLITVTRYRIQGITGTCSYIHKMQIFLHTVPACMPVLQYFAVNTPVTGLISSNRWHMIYHCTWCLFNAFPTLQVIILYYTYYGLTPV